MNKGQIILITGPTMCGKSMLALMMRDSQHAWNRAPVKIWDEPVLSGKGSCKAAIKKHAKTGIAIITSCYSAMYEVNMSITQVIRMTPSK